jgi:hypothetical protein
VSVAYKRTVTVIANDEDWDGPVMAMGFTSRDEFFLLVSSVDLSTPDRLDRFRAWQDRDGTKAGLLGVIEQNGSK